MQAREGLMMDDNEPLIFGNCVPSHEVNSDISHEFLQDVYTLIDYHYLLAICRYKFPEKSTKKEEECLELLDKFLQKWNPKK